MGFPIIPVLAFLGIAGGVSTLVWYANQSRETQMKTDRLAIQWFGKKFKQLSEYQQDQIRQKVA